MRFWDSSAVLPLLIEQPASATVRDYLRADPAMVTWWGTPVECWSAASRLRREQRITVAGEESVKALLELLRESWSEILPTDEVRLHARRLLSVHTLRAADSLQLAAAMLWSGSPPHGEFVTLDTRLAGAARLEGFTTITQ